MSYNEKLSAIMEVSKEYNYNLLDGLLVYLELQKKRIEDKFNAINSQKSHSSKVFSLMKEWNISEELAEEFILSGSADFSIPE